MTSRNHRQGGKICGRHTTIVDVAEPVVDLACRMPEVEKIFAGYITPGVSGGKQHIKINEMLGGFQVVVRGSNGSQKISVYPSANAIEETMEKFERKFL